MTVLVYQTPDLPDLSVGSYRFNPFYPADDGEVCHPDPKCAGKFGYAMQEVVSQSASLPILVTLMGLHNKREAKLFSRN